MPGGLLALLDHLLRALEALGPTAAPRERFRMIGAGVDPRRDRCSVACALAGGDSAPRDGRRDLQGLWAPVHGARARCRRAAARTVGGPSLTRVSRSEHSRGVR